MSLGPIIGLEHDSVVRFPVVLPTGNRKTGERQTDHKQKAPSPPLPRKSASSHCRNMCTSVSRHQVGTQVILVPIIEERDWNDARAHTATPQEE